jgi:hypothetical protein
MSAFCPEGIGACADAEAGPCVVGHPCALHPTLAFTRCPGSGEFQMLDWPPEGDYPGASVCADCMFGVMIVRGSVQDAESEAGVHGRAGQLRVHHVSRGSRTEEPRMKYATSRGVPE